MTTPLAQVSSDAQLLRELVARTLASSAEHAGDGIILSDVRRVEQALRRVERMAEARLAGKRVTADAAESEAAL